MLSCFFGGIKNIEREKKEGFSIPFVSNIEIMGKKQKRNVNDYCCHSDGIE